MNNEEKILEILATMQSDMNDMKADMTEMKDRLVRVELAVENEIPRQIGMLADGHMQLTQQIQRLENKVDGIDERTKTLTVTRASTRDVSDLRQRVIALEDLWDVKRYGSAL